MHNPIRGIVTSEHEDDGGYRRHRGRDIGTRDVNSLGLPVWTYGVGRPVYAAFSGHWKKIVRWSKPGNKGQWTWAVERTGNGGLVANPDGEGQGYNHVLILPKWREGDWINEGELIGHLDLSGNMSAPHLHFECWRNWRDPYSDFSPKILFDKYRVDTMTDPALPPPIILASVSATTATTQTTTGDLTVPQYEELKAGQEELGRKLDRLQASVGGANISIKASNGKTFKTNVNGALKVIETLVRDNNTDIDSILERVGEEAPEAEQQKVEVA